MEDVTVVCVNVGTKYADDWVYRLRSMVARHLRQPHRFVCMSDHQIPDIVCLPHPNYRPGWWAKTNLFEPGRLPGLNLYLDLDVVLTDDIDGMLDVEPGYLYARDDFSYSLLDPKQGLGPDMQRLLGGEGTLQSSVMIWHGDDGAPIWDQFTASKMDEVHGDQNYITQVMWPDQARLIDPQWICSYKYNVLRGDPPAPIVVFHGDPKVNHLRRDDPLRLAWG